MSRTFKVFLNVFVAQALYLLVCPLHSDGVIGFARRHQHGQLITLRSGGIDASRPARQLGFKHFHNFWDRMFSVTHCILSYNFHFFKSKELNL